MLITSELCALVIDDNDHGRILAEQALKQVGLQSVHGAGDVIAGLQIIRDEKIDFVLLDWYMPEINGAGFARLIRKGLATTEPDLPIIITTAYATRENSTRIRELGLREVLAKPFSVKQLSAAISMSLTHLVRADESTSPEPANEDEPAMELEEDQYLL